MAWKMFFVVSLQTDYVFTLMKTTEKNILRNLKQKVMKHRGPNKSITTSKYTSTGTVNIEPPPPINPSEMPMMIDEM